MKVIDNTRCISSHLASNCPNVKQRGTCGTGEWCQFMHVDDGNNYTIHTTFFRHREIKTHAPNAKFEIWNEKTVAIDYVTWDIVFPLIESAIKEFEKETRQSITVKKVSGPTEWGDY